MIQPWFTVHQIGHERYMCDIGITTIAAAKQAVGATYPHFLELPITDAPAHPLLTFDDTRAPWTSFYGENTVIFAFSELRDAIELRLSLR
jgi:hypothetical protein